MVKKKSIIPKRQIINIRSGFFYFATTKCLSHMLTPNNWVCSRYPFHFIFVREKKNDTLSLNSNKDIYYKFFSSSDQPFYILLHTRIVPSFFVLPFTTLSHNNFLMKLFDLSSPIVFWFCKRCLVVYLLNHKMANISLSKPVNIL